MDKNTQLVALVALVKCLKAIFRLLYDAYQGLIQDFIKGRGGKDYTTVFPGYFIREEGGDHNTRQLAQSGE